MLRSGNGCRYAWSVRWGESHIQPQLNLNESPSLTSWYAARRSSGDVSLLFCAVRWSGGFFSSRVPF